MDKDEAVWSEIILRVSRFPAGKTPKSHAADNEGRHTGRSMALAYQLLTGHGNTSGPCAGAVPPMEPCTSSMISFVQQETNLKPSKLRIALGKAFALPTRVSIPLLSNGEAKLAVDFLGGQTSDTIQHQLPNRALDGATFVVQKKHRTTRSLALLLLQVWDPYILSNHSG